MKEGLLRSLRERSLAEPYARLLGMETVHVEPGNATVRMNAGPQTGNIFGSTHGGAIFSLIDEAFQLACNSHGVLSVALNVSITYVAPPGQGALLEARATELCQTSRTSSYLCEVRENPSGKLIATAQALAYRTKKPIEFQTE
ncbi:MAG: hotdog fold thioesterase [Thermodesulfobacteriota bacterium]